jgi:hypothetical protein
VLTLAAISRSIAIAEAARYPTLTANGFDYYRFTDLDRYTKQRQHEDREDLFSESGRIEIACTLQYIKENRVTLDAHSYHLKHRIEDWTDTNGGHKHISNGCAILGLSIAGYEVILIDNSPSCLFRWKGQR